MSAFVLRYLGKVDILYHPKGVDVYAKLMNLGRPKEQRCCLVHLHMFTLQKGVVTLAPLWQETIISRGTTCSLFYHKLITEGEFKKYLYTSVTSPNHVLYISFEC